MNDRIHLFRFIAIEKWLNRNRADPDEIRGEVMDAWNDGFNQCFEQMVNVNSEHEVRRLEEVIYSQRRHFEAIISRQSKRLEELINYKLVKEYEGEL